VDVANGQDNRGRPATQSPGDASHIWNPARVEKVRGHRQDAEQLDDAPDHTHPRRQCCSPWAGSSHAPGCRGLRGSRGIPAAAFGTTALRTDGVRHTWPGWCRWPCRCPQRSETRTDVRPPTHTGHQAWTWVIPAAATADMATRATDTCPGRLHRRPRPASSHDSVVGVRSAWPRPSLLDRRGRPQTLPDTSAAAVRDAVQVPDTADGRPRPLSARGCGARGTGRRVGRRCWDAASAHGREQAGRSGGHGADRGHRSWPAG
jgi:hypothetical protein